MSKENNKVVLFDLDNTLIEIMGSHAYFDSIIIKAFQKEKIKTPIKERNLLWRNSDYKKLLASWGFKDHALFWRIFDEIDYNGRKNMINSGKIAVYNDVESVLKKIKNQSNILTGIITNTTQKIAEYELKIFNLMKYFNIIYGLGDTQELCKPSPNAIAVILSELHSKNYQFKESDVFIVGDSEEDIIAGFSAGIKTVLIDRKSNFTKKTTIKPNYFISKLDNLLEILKI
ncbi:MAG: HAD family hydrolase [Promethearchaeota archaeon]